VFYLGEAQGYNQEGVILENKLIDSKMVGHLFAELDKALAAEGEKREIVIFGSGAMMAQGLLRTERRTEDVDLARPDMDNTFQVIAADVGDKFGLTMGWMNSAGVIFSRNFPVGWEERRTKIYEGKGLVIHSLGRGDLIATKFQALCDRNKPRDVDDITDLKPSKDELAFAKKWVLEQKGSEPDYQRKVESAEKRVLENKSYSRGR
jgi:hypothetical protein